MVNQLKITDLQGQVCSLKGNEPIQLDDPQIVWVIQSGSVALFAVTEGTRRYLFSCDSKEALFGTLLSSDNQHHQLLAVPIAETELLRVDQECFRQLVADGDATVVALVEGWLKHIDPALFEIATPAIQVQAVGQARFSLNDRQTFQPEAGAIAWVQIQQGNVSWMGLEELTLDPKTGIFPLSDRIWLQAIESVQLSTETTIAIRDADVLLTGLSLLHIQFLNYISLLEQQEAQAELQRLQDRERLNRQVTAEALGELISPLSTDKVSFLLEGTPLLIAAGAVGRYLGITIRPPAQSENLKRLKNPLEAIVRASRVRMRQVLLRDNWWKRDSGPLVAYTELDNQPVALLPVSANSYEIFDPVQRTRMPVNDRSVKTLTSVAYMFYRSLPDKGLKAVGLFRFAFKGRGRDLLVIFLTGIAATLLGMLTPYATAILIDNAIPDSDWGLLLQVGLGLLVAALATGLFRLTQGLALLRVETVCDATTQAAIWDRLLNLPVSFFRNYTTGDLHSRVTTISTIRHQLSGATLINLISGIFALLNLLLLFYYSWKLALVAVAVAVVAIALTTLSGVFLVRKVRPLLELKGNIFGQTVQLINGIAKLRIAGAQERAFASWSKNYSRQIKLELSTQNLEDGVTLFNTVMPTLTSAVLFWFTIKLLEDAQTTGGLGLTIGTFLAFKTAFDTFIEGSTDVSNTVTNALQVIPQWKRAQPILESMPEVDLGKADPGKLIGRIKVDHLTFRYRQEGALTLDNVSLHAEPGEFIALVGGSGSGKSTIFRLLLGFETPEDGVIYYDGQDLSGLDVGAVRRQLGVVLQNGQITSASIFDNIASGAQITLDEAWEAARMSGLAEDIAAMPMEMHTVISEGGSNLSGGQRQRLLIARALALKPRILLFDEATSALDNRTQGIVSESLDKLQVTRIAIAHRLSTIRNAHRIYVLQGGRVVQQGTFEELAAVEGLFAQLMARQMM
ncbi:MULTISPECIES: NHLP bacteriocin export ABC transporter permease/ATPase subunit [unclassified Nostoc]|uniref:NHLP bacteriocin export ABC transporter permease/ATPase subunit n=1 Tax=unclassified Nostoc TaxID=2593658 RepID=UPI002AD37670|nr:NHLP bacteriocin export ABC transporter permease/ATPase subunit [Nostoc sp. DedQUE03]MDZ7974761.1 NHLP bacteriocin export ABC transporter permease/ATPase subunit [Nostoc sp. DedQUE03]MDZ8046726.1 NHLP bacteriocin export ABC transporter permease/ATPase subunit [Nostoc sp. DedQUE02]